MLIKIESPPTEATLGAIERGLTAYNDQFSPPRGDEFTLSLNDDDDAVRGGILAFAWAGMLFIKWFWVDDALRGKGHGRALLAAAEEAGRKSGCAAAYLDTFEFQARPFYEKCGYQLFGTLDYPAGFKRYFLQKAL